MYVPELLRIRKERRGENKVGNQRSWMLGSAKSHLEWNRLLHNVKAARSQDFWDLSLFPGPG